MNFFDKYIEAAKKTPDKPVLRIDDSILTYKDFCKKTSLIAGGMKKLGIGENDKVALIMPNSIDWYLVYWSAIRIGAQPVPIDPQSGSMEMRRLIPATTAKVCFVYQKYRNNSILKEISALVPSEISLNAVVAFAEEDSIPQDKTYMSFDKFISDCCDATVETPVFVPDENHIMSLACTSGSTGTPKILSVPNDGFYQAAEDMGDYLAFNDNDVMMLGMTLYHQGGFGMGLQMTLKGGTVMYQPKFDPISFLETVQKLKVTAIQLTSTLAKVLLSVPNFDDYDISSVRICYFAGEVLPRAIAETFVEKLNIRVINVIGSSETATMVVWDSDKDFDTDPSDFKKLSFTDYKVLDKCIDETGRTVGELCIQTTAVITDYFGNSELSAEKIITDENGKRWFRTGDLVEELPDGVVRFAGRSKRIIKRGGNLVHAEEVEACLLTHPDIAAIAVTAEDHPVIGQQIVAYVQPASKDVKVTRGAIARYFDGKLSAYKLPDKVILTDEIPKDVGKIQFKYLRETK